MTATDDEAMTPRPGVLHKYAKDESELWWIDVPRLNMLVMVATNLTAVELILKRLKLTHPQLERIRTSVKDKNLLLRHLLSTRVLDCEVINHNF